MVKGLILERLMVFDNPTLKKLIKPRKEDLIFK
jgi:hypothetical protein